MISRIIYDKICVIPFVNTKDDIAKKISLWHMQAGERDKYMNKLIMRMSDKIIIALQRTEVTC
jgi:hypothetical protein